MIQPIPLSHDAVAHSLALFRQHSPLIHCMGFASLPGDRLLNVASACRVVAVAGERAAAQAAGLGSFIPAFLDELYQLTPEKL